MSEYTLKIIVEGIDKASGPLNTIGGSLQRVGEIAAGVSLANMFSSIASGLQSVTGQALQSYASFERLSMSINALSAREALQTGRASSMQEALSKTSGQAKELVNWIERLAIQSPFGEADVASTFKLSLAMGFTTKEAQRTTQALLDFSAATGAGSDKMVQLGQALGKIKTTGKISGEEIRQLAEAGLNATQILGDAFGKTPKQIADMVSKGQIDASKAIDAITASLEKFYGGSGARQANSMSGLLESLQQIKEMTGRDFFAPMFQTLQPYIADITGALSSDTFRAIVDKLGTLAGQGLAGALSQAVTSAQQIASSIEPLLNAQSPAWLTALTGLFAAEGGQNLAVWIEPKVKDGGGVTFDTTTASFTFDLQGKLQAIDFNQLFGTDPAVHWDPTTGLTFDAKTRIISFEGLSEANLFPDWGTGLPKRLAARLIADTTAEFQKSGVIITADWGTGVSGRLWTAMQNAFNTPLSVYADWGQGAIQSLWTAIQSFFTSNPFNIFTTASSGTAAAYDTPYGAQMRNRNDLANEMLRPHTGVGYASGGAVRSGWAWVGERGAELMHVGAGGVQIFSNEESRLLSAGNVPGYADGTGPTIVGGALNDLFKAIAAALGIQSGRQSWEVAAERGWVQVQEKATTALQQTADAATSAFEGAAKKTADVFKSALGNVPGVFGTSEVTDRQMKLAAAGVPQNFADDYIRKLSDEVLNGKEWGDQIDIKDAARRAGIDPNLPNEIILDLVKEAWNNSSFFANKGNVDLINTDAIKQSMEQQQKEAQGKANILSFFGLDNQAEAGQATALGQAIQNAFGAIPPETLKGAGATVMAQLSAGFGDPMAAGTAVSNLGGALVAALGTTDGAAAISVSGIEIANTQYRAYSSRMAELPPVPPSGGATLPTDATPPGKALGGHARGWTVVGEYGPELVNLGDAGARVYSNSDSERMLGAGGNTYVTNNFNVGSNLQAEITARKVVDHIRRRSR